MLGSFPSPRQCGLHAWRWSSNVHTSIPGCIAYTAAGICDWSSSILHHRILMRTLTNNIIISCMQVPTTLFFQDLWNCSSHNSTPLFVPHLISFSNSDKNNCIWTPFHINFLWIINLHTQNYIAMISWSQQGTSLSLTYFPHWLPIVWPLKAQCILLWI